MSDYRVFAEELAHKAGKIMRDFFQLGMQKKWKEDSSPITEADQKINDMVLEAVAERFPEHGVVAEEGSKFNNEEYVWICDPIDGTVPFSHGIPTSTFMVALTKNGESILGVIYDPFEDRLVVAEKGKGAFLNGEQIHVSKREQLESSVIAMNYWKHDRKILREAHYAFVKSKVSLIILPSVGYLDILVAMGEISASIFGGSNPWDSAAAAVIVTEAGGKYTDLEGNAPRFDGEVNGHIASNGLIHDTILELVKKDLHPQS